MRECPTQPHCLGGDFLRGQEDTPRKSEFSAQTAYAHGQGHVRVSGNIFRVVRCVNGSSNAKSAPEIRKTWRARPRAFPSLGTAQGRRKCVVTIWHRCYDCQSQAPLDSPSYSVASSLLTEAAASKLNVEALPRIWHLLCAFKSATYDPYEEVTHSTPPVHCRY